MVAGEIFTGRTEAAQPRPIRQGPSRIRPGSGSRAAQPKASAPASKQAMSGRDENGLPEIGSVSVSLRRRSSMGSSPRATAISSTALSRRRGRAPRGCPHRPRGVAVDPRGALVGAHGRAGIEARSDVGALHGEGVEARGDDLGLVHECGEAPVLGRPQADVVPGLRAMIGDSEAVPAAGDQETGRPRMRAASATGAVYCDRANFAAENGRRSDPTPPGCPPDRGRAARRGRAGPRQCSARARKR